MYSLAQSAVTAPMTSGQAINQAKWDMDWCMNQQVHQLPEPSKGAMILTMMLMMLHVDLSCSLHASDSLSYHEHYPVWLVILKLSVQTRSAVMLACILFMTSDTQRPYRLICSDLALHLKYIGGVGFGSAYCWKLSVLKKERKLPINMYKATRRDEEPRFQLI